MAYDGYRAHGMGYSSGLSLLAPRSTSSTLFALSPRNAMGDGPQIGVIYIRQRTGSEEIVAP